jgi:hypothetical protein
MIVGVLTSAYNEAFLLPFFLRHYGWADKVHVLFDTDTSDNSRAILDADGRVDYHPLTFPAGLDELFKVNVLNDYFRTLKDDVIVCVDVDEFIHIDRAGVERVGRFPAVMTRNHDVFRHASDADLDVSIPIRQQRRHGVRTVRDRDPNVKPAIVWGGIPIEWAPGQHFLTSRCTVPVDCGVEGSHWGNADPCYCIDRRLSRRARNGAVNQMLRMNVHNADVTEESLRSYCALHLYDPELWEAA